MSLKTYHAKRHFNRTAEPKGKEHSSTPAPKSLIFVVQKHAASHLHYDFRLELDGVLKSWAVPKGPSLDPADRRLAVQVEDHPIEYATFEGTIPQGEYGGGTVMVWDHGTWEPSTDDPAAALKAGKLTFTLQGDKLTGAWMLVRMGAWGGRSGSSGKPQWLLRKIQDKAAKPASKYDITVKEPNSIQSGRTMDQITSGKSKVWRSNRKGSVQSPRGHAGATNDAEPPVAPPRSRIVEPKSKRTTRSTSKLLLPGARIAPMPTGIEPELATLVESAPSGSEWIHEVKFDGYRMLAYANNGKARLISRNDKDWTTRFGRIAKAVAALDADQAIFDGEIVALNKAGVSSFQALQNVLKNPDASPDLAYYLFDILYLDGQDLRGSTLQDRRTLLEDLLDRSGPKPSANSRKSKPLIRLSDSIRGRGVDVLQQACKLALEGVVSKRLDSTYEAGRTMSWVKSKCINRQEFVIGGYTDPQRSRPGMGALLIGYYKGDDLMYAGKVGTGFDHKMLVDFAKRLKAMQLPEPAFSDPPRGYEARLAHWVEPKLVCEVEFTEWTNDGQIRHPSFIGLREDKDPHDVVRETRRSAGARAHRSRRAATPVPRVPDDDEGPRQSDNRKSNPWAALGTPVRSDPDIDSIPITGRIVTVPPKLSYRAGSPVPRTSNPRATPGRTARDSDEAPAKRSSRRGDTAQRAEPALTGRIVELGPKSKRVVAAQDPEVLGVRISHPERVLYEDQGGGGVTKLELAQYYERIAKWIMPHVLGRPLTLVRCPQGQGKQCFYQKNWEEGEAVGGHIREIPLASASITCLFIDDPSGLVWLVQRGVLEVHTWGSTEKDLERPDRIVFDLDPGPDISWRDLVEAAKDVRDILKKKGLASFPKTTGGKGIHVVVPLKPKADWDQVKDFAAAIAQGMEQQDPDRYVSNMAKSKRHGRIFVDYLRNGRGATFVAAYSTRSRPGAPVSVPVSWEELARMKDNPHFSTQDALKRVERKGFKDPWGTGWQKTKQVLPKLEDEMKGNVITLGARGRR